MLVGRRETNPQRPQGAKKDSVDKFVDVAICTKSGEVVGGMNQTLLSRSAIFCEGIVDVSFHLQVLPLASPLDLTLHGTFFRPPDQHNFLPAISVSNQDNPL
ncbi:hypothetical protein CGCF413_v014276 [Colletotrichum fructicola]|nr:hypothetical protein CGCF413_v014276 [Colletotrichum fructicola]